MKTLGELQQEKTDEVREALETAKAFLVYIWNNYELEEDTGDCDEAITMIEKALTCD